MAVVGGLIILAAFVGITLNMNVMMRSVGNYSDLDKYSRNTLDMLSRDIRNAAAVSSASTSTSLTLTNTYSRDKRHHLFLGRGQHGHPHFEQWDAVNADQLRLPQVSSTVSYASHQ